MKLSSLFFALVLVITFSSCSKESVEENEANLTEAITVTPKSVEDIVLTEQLVVAINNYRVSKNLTTILLDNGTAESLAMSHCAYMSTKNTASHDNFLSRATTLKNNGASSVKETVAYGYTNAQSIVNAWINSDSHREALEGDFNHVGVGFTNSANNTKYCTAIFYKK